MTQGKIERYHRSMKNLAQLRTCNCPRDLERETPHFVDYCNNQRYRESLGIVTPADVYFGRAKEVQSRREEIKRRTIEARRQHPILADTVHAEGIRYGGQDRVGLPLSRSTAGRVTQPWP